jgi:glycosyltransferase involved in cell wall biosynthesis
MRTIKKIALMAVGDSAWQGGIQYIVNIMHALDAVSTGASLEVHLFRHPHQKFSDLDRFTRIRLCVHNIDEVLPPWSLGNRIFWYLQRKFSNRIYPRLENYLLRHQFDYVYPATLSDCNGRLNVGSWIADFQYKNYPDGHNKETTLQAEKTIGTIAKKMPKVIFSSAYCEEECFSIFPEAKGKTFVMPFAVFMDRQHFTTSLDQVRNHYDIHGPFLMVSNLFAATKNHKTLFAALGILRKEGLKIPLVCTGNLVNSSQIEFTNEVLNMITSYGIRDQLYLLGLIPRNHQVSLYRMAVAMVQPSLHEGWSTCVEEAKALGKTLIVSDIGVHREQWPDNTLFFDPLDEVMLANHVRQQWKATSSTDFPDLDKEARSLQHYEEITVRAFGQNFLSIASA